MTKYTILYTAIFLATTLLLLSFMLVPNLSLAQSDPSLPNPLDPDGQPVKITVILLRIMQVALAVVDIFALFMFILGGFEFLVSAGNPNMVKKAKDTLLWATIGILVITLSYSLLKFIFEKVSAGL